MDSNDRKQVVHVFPYLGTFHIMGRDYDIHNGEDENRGDCVRCDGMGVIYRWRHRDDGLCYACRGTGGKKKKWKEPTDIIVVPPSLQKGFTDPTGLRLEKKQGRWTPMFPNSSSSEMMEAVLVKDYKAMSPEDFEEVHSGAGSGYEYVWKRYFDWQRVMIQEINKLQKEGKLKFRGSP